MRKLLVLLLCLPLIAISQSNFEGTIVYRTQQKGFMGINMSMTIRYSKTKVQMTNRVGIGEQAIESTQLFDFTNCLSYNIDHASRTYSVDSLENEKEEIQGIRATNDTATIAGYHTIKYLLKETDPGLDTTNNGTSTFLRISPAVVYRIPENCQKRMNMFASTGYNMCWLEMGVAFGNAKDSMLLRAEQIIPGPVNEDSLTLPASYAYRKEEFKVDSITVVESKDPPPPPPPPPVKKTANKTNIPAKGSIRKEQ